MTSPRGALLTGTSKPSFSNRPKRILVLLGTRPEAIKLAPLIQELRRTLPGVQTVVCATGQHREMLDQVLSAFEIDPDYKLDVMQSGQTLAGTTARLMASLEPVLGEVQPTLALVQGDTTTTLCGALCCFYAHVPVAHVEAGLRTGNIGAPFPEEMNRTLTSRLARLHFAPTEGAATNLRDERVRPEDILVTGNTGIDAVMQVRAGLQAGTLAGYAEPLPPRKIILITAHRRESFGKPLGRVTAAIVRLAERSDVHIVWPVHPNPVVREFVYAQVGQHANVTLLPPLLYVPFVDLMSRAAIILTDSGGIQEEAPSLGKPVLVLRETTERSEAVEAGTVKLVGTDPDVIVRESNRLLDDASERKRMSRIHNPYGDGHASERIALRIRSFLHTHDVG